MPHLNLLVVEDDAAIQEMLRFSLEDDGMRLHPATTLKQARALLQSRRPDLVLLDWMLPDGSGIELLRHIRQRQAELPVIMITARGEEDDRIRGLESGADDYLCKPFSPRELRARIQAVLRRSRKQDQPLRQGGIKLDPQSRRVECEGRELRLSPTEFRLLHWFMLHPDRVFSREQLLDQVWGTQVFVEERTVDVHIRRLRKALAGCAHDSLIQTVHGHGYRFSLK